MYSSIKPIIITYNNHELMGSAAGHAGHSSLEQAELSYFHREITKMKVNVPIVSTKIGKQCSKRNQMKPNLPCPVH